MFYPLIIGDLLMIATAILKFTRLPPQIPLFYSKPWGEDQLADTWMIAVLPATLNVLYCMNLLILKKYFPANEFAAKIIRYLNIFLATSLSLIFVKIIFLVT